MALNAKKIPSGGGNFKRPPSLEAGNYPARLVQVIDMGLQPQRAYQGKDKPPRGEIYTTYELLDEFLQDDDGNDLENKPRWISETLPMHSLDSDLAKSTKRYVALDPKLQYDGDWSQLPGTPCMVTLSADEDKKGKKDQDGNTIVYNNVSSIQPMRAKDVDKAESLKNPPKVFDTSDPDMEVFLSLPDWLRDKIKEALDFEGGPLEEALGKISEKEEVEKRRQARKDEAPKKEEKSEEPESNDEGDGDDW